MPPPKIANPQFSPVGRYLINVDARKTALAAGQPALFHDTQNFKEECGLGEVPTTSHSRFDNMTWALQRRFIRCANCFS